MIYINKRTQTNSMKKLLLTLAILCSFSITNTQAQTTAVEIPLYEFFNPDTLALVMYIFEDDKQLAERKEVQFVRDKHMMCVMVGDKRYDVIKIEKNMGETMMTVESRVSMYRSIFVNLETMAVYLWK